MGMWSMLGKQAGKSLAKATQHKEPGLTKDDFRQMAHDLSQSSGVSKEHIEDLIRYAGKREIPQIINYLKGSDSTNLTNWTRAVLIHAAKEKLDILNIMSHLMH